MRFSFSLLFAVVACSVAPLPAWSQTSAQVRLITPVTAANHVFGSSLFAPLGRSCEIDGSTNLTSWTSVTNGIVADSVPFADGNAPQFPRRFYRADLDWTIMVPNNYLIFYTNSGKDGRVIAYP